MIEVKTSDRFEVVDITNEVQDLVEKSGVKDGVCVVFVVHATAGITLLENYDPDICSDFMEFLEKIVPHGVWKHDRVDGNGDAHIKAAIVGPSECLVVKNGKLVLGTWQSLVLCEFDGPRKRKVVVKVLG